MIFFCRKTSTADGRTRWSVCVPTLMGFTTIAWFYSESLADNFIRHLESNEEDRHLASLDAWREFQFRLDFIWSEKLQQERAGLEKGQERPQQKKAHISSESKRTLFVSQGSEKIF